MFCAGDEKAMYIITPVFTCTYWYVHFNYINQTECIGYLFFWG